MLTEAASFEESRKRINQKVEQHPEVVCAAS
jgi:hypothetical protein